jgi:hypothetical protein
MARENRRILDFDAETHLHLVGGTVHASNIAPSRAFVHGLAILWPAK